MQFRKQVLKSLENFPNILIKFFLKNSRLIITVKNKRKTQKILNACQNEVNWNAQILMMRYQFVFSVKRDRQRLDFLRRFVKPNVFGYFSVVSYLTKFLSIVLSTYKKTTRQEFLLTHSRWIEKIRIITISHPQL